MYIDMQCHKDTSSHCFSYSCVCKAWFDSVTLWAYNVWLPEFFVSLRMQSSPASPAPNKSLAGRCLATSTLKLVSDIYCMAPVQIISRISFGRASVRSWQAWRGLFGAGNYFAEAPASWPRLFNFGIFLPLTRTCKRYLHLTDVLVVWVWSQGENWSIYTARWRFGNAWFRGEAAGSEGWSWTGSCFP